MYKKKLLGIIIILLYCNSNAQTSTEKKRIDTLMPIYQQIIFAGSGGMSWLYYNPKIGNSHINGTGNIGIEYGVWFTKNWGIRMGLHIDYFSGGINAPSIQGTTVNIPNDTLKYSYTNYKEKNQILLLSIPLMAQYEYAFTPKVSVYTALGFKLGIPLFTETHITGNLLGTTVAPLGANPDVIISAFDKKVDVKQTLNFSSVAMVAIEIGLKYPLKNKWNLYTGLYCDYGLNSMSQGNTSLVSHKFNNPYELIYRSMASASKLHPLMFGISIKISKDKMPKIKH